MFVTIQLNLLRNLRSADGYFVVILYKNNKIKYIKVHRLIATSFIDNPSNKPFVDHIDNNRLNNNKNNLRWCTQRQNCMNSSFRNDNFSGERCVVAQKNKS